MTIAYPDFEPLLKILLDSVSNELSADAVNHVSHYLSVGEYEMAFESLVLSLMEEQVVIGNKAAREIEIIGQGLNMAEEAVFRADFWPAAISWLQEQVGSRR